MFLTLHADAGRFMGGIFTIHVEAGLFVGGFYMLTFYTMGMTTAKEGVSTMDLDH